MKLKFSHVVVLLLLISGSATAQQSRSVDERATELTRQAVDDFRQGRLIQAERKLQQSLSLKEKNVQAHFWLGRIYATRAGSSPRERQRAIEAFSRALQIESAGEYGDQARGWLLRIGGRPRRVLFLRARADKQSRGATRDVLEKLPSLAVADGFEVQEATRREDNSHQQGVDKNHLLSLCKDANGTLTVGWLVGVSVEEFKVERMSGRGRRDMGYVANGQAKISVFDPLAREVLPVITVTGATSNLVSALLGVREDSSSTAYQNGLDNLSQNIWDQLQRVVALLPDNRLLDEVDLPLPIDGTSARAAVSYEKAMHLPLVIFPSCMVEGEEDAKAAKTVESRLQTALLESGKVTLLSPGNTRIALSEMGYPEGHNAQNLSKIAARLGSRYVVFTSLKNLDVDVGEKVIATKIKARVTLLVMVLDTYSGEYVLRKAYREESGATKYLSGKAVTTFLKQREKVVQTACEKASRDILAALIAAD